MSDITLFGVLRMPKEMAMADELSRHQFWDRAQQACDRIAALEAELARVKVERDALREDAERLDQQTPKAPAYNILWLWRNFVDGKPEYWAFDNPYPCDENGDPMTLGDPCGYAYLKASTRGRPDVSDVEVMKKLLESGTAIDAARKEGGRKRRKTSAPLPQSSNG